MTDIIMIKVTEQNGDEWNINLSYVLAVELGTGTAAFDTIYYNRGEAVRTLTLQAGEWEAALDRLIADFNTNPKVIDHLFVGTT